jgi:hypothetical protein
MPVNPSSENMESRHAKHILILMATIIAWSGICFIGKYGKSVIGNRQEIYPSLLLPGFLRNQQKTKQQIFLKRRMVATSQSGDVFDLPPEAVFGYFGFFAMGALLEQDGNLDAGANQRWHSNLPDSIVKIHLLEQVYQYRSNTGTADFPLLESREKTYILIPAN